MVGNFVIFELLLCQFSSNSTKSFASMWNDDDDENNEMMMCPCGIGCGWLLLQLPLYCYYKTIDHLILNFNFSYVLATVWV